MARPRIVLTEEQEKTIIRYASYGLHSDEIASNLEYVFNMKISGRSLRGPRFCHLLAKGEHIGKRIWIERLDTQSAKGNVVATIFGLKNRCGWSDKTETSIVGLPVKQFEASTDLPASRARFGYAHKPGGNGNGKHKGNGDGQGDEDISRPEETQASN